MVRFVLPAGTLGAAAPVGAALVLALQNGALAAPCPCAKIEVYVDCAAKAGGTGKQDSPFSSLAPVNGLKLKAGDSIRLKRGASCQGSLTVRGAGEAGKPIVIGPYGDGGKAPVVQATGAEQALLLEDAQYVQVSGLELTAPGDGTRPRRGVYVLAKDSGTMHGIQLTGLDVHDVRGEAKPSAPNAGGAAASGGIVVEAAGSATPTTFDDLKINGNRVHAVDGAGISVWSSWCRRPDTPSPDGCSQAWTPIRRLAINGDLLWDVGGTGIQVAATQGASITGNHIEGFNARSGTFGAGVAVAGSTGTGVSGNDVSGGKTGGTGAASAGGMAYDVGTGTEGLALKANLSHDNRGGFVHLCAASGFTLSGNVSIDDRAHGFQVCDAPLTGGTIRGNTVYLADGVEQLVVDADTEQKLDVKFTGNLVERDGTKGTVGWNVASPAWVVDHNLLHGFPVPATATATIKADPGFLAPGLADPVAYQLIAGSPAIGAGVGAGVGAGAAKGGIDGFPVSPAKVPAATPNIGGVQAPAAFPAGLADSFNAATPGQAPAGWQVTGSAAAAADPSGGLGSSLVLTERPTPSTAVRLLPVSGGVVRVRARLRASDTGHTGWLKVLDAKDGTVAAVGLTPGGHVAFTDGKHEEQSAAAYPPNAWVPVSLLIRPEDGAYELSVNGVQQAKGALGEGAGLAAKIQAALSPGPDAAKGTATFTVDDVLVTPEPCPPAPMHDDHA
ncbi:right-handed parallel beta-helix repeat-containing protein [Actinomadura barringtoniae]|uniref:Right-handed parallel beta-helix repeat-containing protein n=1 Tax=Actinomadura barringtoniae TaxID=1427535 RepID=A0A939PAD2_9ACTN|nr:right-handed parallel beta-helix repeat-containing protein [Actinomadura barringtoniae]MBO2448487.1 right-handed parallel beta-helix repeat-containing protein [Actinomadura barringtoniae]